MSADFHSLFGSPRREMLRWVLCFAAILTVHGAAALTMLATSAPEDGEMSDVTSAVTVDFVTQPMAEAPPRFVAAGIEQVQTEAAPPPAEQKSDPTEDTVKQPVAVEASKTPVEDSRETKPVAEEPLPLPQLPTVPDAEVAVTTVAPPPPPAEKKKEEETDKKSEAQSAPPLATASETTAPTSAAARTASVTSWRRRIATHLQRFKRYPAAAEARREEGTAMVEFTVDRKGSITGARLESSTGYPLLDDEVMTLVRRALPLPLPPEIVPDNELSLRVPIRFSRK